MDMPMELEGIKSNRILVGKALGKRSLEILGR
jgi:hypothetical protein